MWLESNGLRPVAEIPRGAGGRGLLLGWALLALAACQSSAACAPLPASPPRGAPVTSESGAGTRATPVREVVTTDTERATPNGVRYTVPSGWALTIAERLTLLSPPEADSQVVIADSTLADPDAAVAAVWRDIGRTPRLELATETPARDSWEQAREYAYEVSPSAKRWAFARALRRGSVWTIVLYDVASATGEKRGAQLTLLSHSIRPQDHVRESFAGRRAHALDAERLAQVDAFIAAARAELGVVGVSLAIVQGNAVVLAKGYGERQLGRPDAVGADTLFLVASNTKALTTLLLAQLVDEGKLRWDQPVREVYPSFRLGDEATTRATRIEHLVCACTGLPRSDNEVIFEFDGLTPRMAVESLAAIAPTTPFGETYQYSNQLAAAAGFIAAYVNSPDQELGRGYDLAMRERVLAPLGMTASTFDFARALAQEHASPHAWNVDGQTEVAPMAFNEVIYPLRPAGGLWSSARELLQYVRLELSRGVAPSGQRLVGEHNLLRRRQPYASMGEQQAYGIGLIVDQRYGVTVISHGGSLVGYQSDMLWLPEHGVGAVILTNHDNGAALSGSFSRFLLELLFDGKPEALEDVRSAARNLRGSIAEERARLRVPPDPDARRALAERYQSPVLGTLRVLSDAAHIFFDVGEWRTEVAARDADDGTLSFVSVTPGYGGFVFVAGGGQPRTLTLRDAQHEYVFSEVVKSMDRPTGPARATP